jgi:hypothetical protein
LACQQNDKTCDDACWNQSGCAANEQPCLDALSQCDTQCPLPAGAQG